MHYLFLFTSFHGRISRIEWWIGSVVLAIVGLAERWLFGSFTPKHLLSWPYTFWQLALLIPAAALFIKRLNDRDRPSWVGQTYVAMAIVFSLAPHLGLFILPNARGLGAILFWIYAPFGLWILVDMAFVRGTDGPNRHGPDPLAQQALAA